ncbi:ribokinase [Promicromonospora sukumoe]|uniref:Ribokinase n=1 Tax=Promicromonospora sukumoe TaxID=88382 RepID=A0A7W3PBU5_9MICO|nr:ribokinase [Promicromonospora sukumoe]MBA8806068.1 ribokinase [Promicromonospora sukumoe]
MPTEDAAGAARAAVAVIGSYAKALVMTADRIPAPGETLIGRDYRGTFGGKGSDMAVQAARLGAGVSYLGVVGDDTHGAEFRALLADEGVDPVGLRVAPGESTGVGFIVKDTAGRNVIVVDPGANDSFSPADVDAAAGALTAADVALAQLEIPLPTALHALTVARAAGVTTILNPAPAVDLRGTDLTSVDVLTPNEHEAKVALGLGPDDARPPAELGRRLLALGPRAVVVTLGEAGALVVTADGDTRVAPVRVDVVDSNGAGDSFNAALAVALGEGRDLADAARFAGTVAALCCEHWETVPSYQDRATVEAFLARAETTTTTTTEASR